MNEQTFKDYYKILQVHYDASTEIIQAAYAKLSENLAEDDPDAALLKEAYLVLTNEKRRSIYHREWLANFVERAQFIQLAPKPYTTSADDKKASAEDVLCDFFQALFLKDWDNAYLRLSHADRDAVSLQDFTEWRMAISKCYEMHEFSVRYMRTLDSITLDTITYHQVAEFQVIVNDEDCWRVCLGMRDIRSEIWKYRQLAHKSHEENSHMSAELLTNEERVDALTGLLSEAGFFEEAGREVDRNRRYHNPFTLLSFQVFCDDKERETACVCHLADTIHSACRSTDLAARLDNNQIICLLVETDMDNAEAAAQKFLNILQDNPSENYRVSFGLVFYNGYSSLSDAVLACCHMAGLPSHY